MMPAETQSPAELANAAPGAKSQASVITPQRISLALQGRWNPIRGLTPELLVSHIDAYNTGRLRSLAMLMDAIEQRDIGIKTVVAKRKKAVARLPWEILTIDDAPEAQAAKHKETLLWFYNHVTASDVLKQDQVGGLSALIRQMMDAQGKGYACHEILWRPQARGQLSAEFRFCPVWWFESITGKLRFLPEEYALNGVDLEEGGWLVSAGDALMIPTAIAYIYKQWPLRDWSAFCEKYGLPGVIGSTDSQPGSSEWTAIATAVASLINDWSCVKAKGDEIALLEAKAGGTNLPFPPLIEYMDRKIAALWRGADLSTISQGGESSGASLQGDEADMLLEDDAAWVEETLDRQISRTVIRYVHGDEEPLAYLKLTTPKKRQIDADDKAIRLCLEAGIPLGVDATRERLGLPKPDKDDALLSRPAAPPTDPSDPSNSSDHAKTPQDAPGAAEATNTAPDGQKIKLKAVKGQGIDSGAAGDPRFLASASSQFGQAIAADLAPLRRRLAAVEKISDPDIRRARLEAILAEWDSLAADVTADPEAAQALARIQGTAMANGLSTAQDVSR